MADSVYDKIISIKKVTEQYKAGLRDSPTLKASEFDDNDRFLAVAIDDNKEELILLSEQVEANTKAILERQSATSWNPQETNEYPTPEAEEQAWYVLLNEGTTSYDFDGKTWFNLDYLVYSVEADPQFRKVANKVQSTEEITRPNGEVLENTLLDLENNKLDEDKLINTPRIYEAIQQFISPFSVRRSADTEFQRLDAVVKDRTVEFTHYQNDSTTDGFKFLERRSDGTGVIYELMQLSDAEFTYKGQDVALKSDVGAPNKWTPSIMPAEALQLNEPNPEFGDNTTVIAINNQVKISPVNASKPFGVMATTKLDSGINGISFCIGTEDSTRDAVWQMSSRILGDVYSVVTVQRTAANEFTATLGSATFTLTDSQFINSDFTVGMRSDGNSVYIAAYVDGSRAAESSISLPTAYNAEQIEIYLSYATTTTPSNQPVIVQNLADLSPAGGVTLFLEDKRKVDPASYPADRASKQFIVTDLDSSAYMNDDSEIIEGSLVTFDDDGNHADTSTSAPRLDQRYVKKEDVVSIYPWEPVVVPGAAMPADQPYQNATVSSTASEVVISPVDKSTEFISISKAEVTVTRTPQAVMLCVNEDAVGADFGFALQLVQLRNGAPSIGFPILQCNRTGVNEWELKNLSGGAVTLTDSQVINSNLAGVVSAVDNTATFSVYDGDFDSTPLFVEEHSPGFPIENESYYIMINGAPVGGISPTNTPSIKQDIATLEPFKGIRIFSEFMASIPESSYPVDRANKEYLVNVDGEVLLENGSIITDGSQVSFNSKAELGDNSSNTRKLNRQYVTRKEYVKVDGNKGWDARFQNVQGYLPSMGITAKANDIIVIPSDSGAVDGVDILLPTLNAQSDLYCDYLKDGDEITIYNREKKQSGDEFLGMTFVTDSDYIINPGQSSVLVNPTESFAANEYCVVTLQYISFRWYVKNPLSYLPK